MLLADGFSAEGLLSVERVSKIERGKMNEKLAC